MKRLSSLLALGLLLAVGACASPARVGNMVAQPTAATFATPGSPLSKTLDVADVRGGRETNPMLASQVGTAELREALVSSLRSHGLLSDAPGGARYLVAADLLRLDQPLFGLNMTVTASVNYTVTRVSDRNPIFARTIDAPYTAAVGDAFYGPDRLKLANEGAILDCLQLVVREQC